MAITEEQRAILIERLKKGREAAAAKKKASADAPVAPATKAKKEPKEPKAPAALNKGEVIMKVKPLGETEFKEIRLEDPEEVEVPVPTLTAAEVYAPKAASLNEPPSVVKRSAPIDIPHPKSDKKASKDKGYMKLKFYTQPSPKVLKKLMAIHDDSSSDEDSEDEMPVTKTAAKAAPAPAADNERKMRLKQAADYYFNYY